MMEEKIKKIGLYLHVPFCLSKCPYCDFYSVKAQDEWMDRYTDTLCQMIGQDVFSTPVQADTLYFGGGTPVLLGEKNLARILDAVFRKYGSNMEEITLEANPAAAQLPLFRQLRRLGINRLSMGLQSANEEELRFLGRLHTAEQARQAVYDAREAGFENISLDLMLALPGQDHASVLRSIDFCTRLEVEHLSAYLLKIEPDTPFGKQHLEKKCPDEEAQADQYLFAVQSLADRGYQQYEISNFCRPGKESRHNLKYWNGEEYLGIGPGAHSFIEGTRYAIKRDLQVFCQADSLAGILEKTGTGGDFEEYVMLRLRLTQGLVRGEVEERFHRDFGAILKKAKPLEKAGLAVTEKDRLFLTPKGFLVSNQIIAYLTLNG